MFDCTAVIPVYNRKTTVQRAIDSIINQSVPLREVIVVDDGSTDGTADFIQSNYPDVKVLSQPNKGVSAARNAGIEESSGEWIAFLDSDDQWLSNKIETQSHWLLTHPDVLICHCDEIWIRNNIRVNPKKRHKKQGGWIYLNCLPLCVISPSAVVIHRKVFEAIGIFDETLPACEDYDLWLRITKKFEVGYVDQPLLVKYGGHSDQLSRKYKAIDRFRITALAKSLNSDCLPLEHRKKTLETLIEKIEIYLGGARKRSKSNQVLDYQVMRNHYIAQLEQIG